METHRMRRDLIPDNHDDRTASDLLIQKLFDKRQEPSTSSSSLKYKQSKLCKYNKNKLKCSRASYNPKSWIKFDIAKNRKSSNVSKTNTENQKQLEAGENVGTKEDNSKKHGIKLPTLQEALATRSKIENDIQRVNVLIGSIKPLPDHISYKVCESSVYKVQLDCKHLTESEIKSACKKNYQYMLDIHTGERYCKRYELYRTSCSRNNFGRSDLIYNTSMITFTFDQKQWLLTFLSKHFSNQIYCISKNDDYFFKVLLPELCLKIFMDIHNMDEKEAIDYLDKQPININ